MTNVRSMPKQNSRRRKFLPALLAKIKAIPQAFLLIVLGFSLLFSSQAVNAAAGETGFAWDLIRKDNGQSVCAINITHEGEPTSDEIKQICGNDLFTGWQNGAYSLSKITPTATPTAVTYSWLDTPKTAAGLQTNIQLTYLAGKLIAAGYVDVSACNGSALLPNGYASPCGMTAARPYVFIWQNRFDELILNSAVKENIPAAMFKNLLIQESQMWPQASGHIPPEYGIGQLTENGTDTLLMWNTPFFKKMCNDVLDVENCKKDYLSISASERAFLRGSTLIKVRADCANCANKINLEITEKSIPIFAAALKANFHQIDQIAKNLTGKAAVSQMEWQEVWKLSTANYHAGPGCTSSAMRATLRDKKPLRWKYISKNFQAGCESAVDYVEHIITTENSAEFSSANEIESARRVIYGLPALTPTADGTVSATPTSDAASTATATPGPSDLSVSQQLESAHVQNQLVLKIDPQNSAEALQVINDLGINLTADSTSIESLNSLVVNVEESKLNNVLTTLQNSASVEFADPNYLVVAAGAPDDPQFPNQSNLSVIQAPQTWDALPMMSQILVAVIDTGVDVTHPDLVNAIWQNPAESGLDANGADKRSNNVDDDSNGYVDDWQGWNMMAGNNNVSDDQGHGSHLAGIIGAQANNGIGIAGIAPNARILPIKVLDNSGYGTHAMVAEGIVYAVDMGARVINLGFGGTGSSDILLNAVDYALAHQVIVVAAGGNKGDNTIYYPAGYSGVIAVSAVDNGFSQPAFSSYGDHISLSAPGVDIQSTFPGGTYSLASGTSMASAHVSGVAVLLAGQPQFSDVNFLTSALFNKALDLGTVGRDPYFGYGVIQAFDALNYGGPIVIPPVLGDVPVIPGGDVGMLTDMAGSTISSYSPSCGTAAYSTALGGTSVPSLLVNNAVSTPIPLGFEFWYMGTRYTEVYVSSNGWLSFNDPGADTLTLNDLDNSAINAANAAARPILAPLWDNLGGAGTGSAASYVTSGISPNRTFTFEWWNYQWNDAAASRISMRVVLHESTGIVDFMYYPNNANVGNTASAGITGTANNSFISAENLNACPTWNMATETTSLNTKPPLDTVYTFTPSLVALNSPGNLNLTNVTSSSVTLNWTDNSIGEDGFSIYTSTDGVNYTYFGQTAPNITIFNATGLANSANNYWKVYAAVEGNASTSAAVDAPTALNFTNVAVTSMTLNWTDNSGNDTGFYVFRSTDNINFSPVTKTIANAVSYNATGLLPNTTYYWRVQAAADAAAENAISAAASAAQITQPNTLPSAGITSPAVNSIFTQGTAVTFAGTGTDTEDGDITASLQWTSSIDGLIGSGVTFTKSDLSLGVHTITATAKDSFNGTASIMLTLTITDAAGNAPALITIDTPANNTTFVQGSLISFGGTAIDTLDGNISANLQWNSNVDGALGTGAGVSTSTLSLGTHRITASVTDSGGLSSSTDIRITITDAAGNTPPLVTISSPSNGTSFSQGAPIFYIGSALIPTNGNISNLLTWKDGATTIGAGASFSISNLSLGTHTITASATDSKGLTGLDTITITITEARSDPHGGFTVTTDKCAACHRTHTAQSPELIASPLTGNAFCLSCHSDGSVTVSTHSNKDWGGPSIEKPVPASFELLCTQCHEPHGSSNLSSIRSNVWINSTGSITTGPVIFTAKTGLNSYDDGVSATANRLCVACHVNPNNPGGPMKNHPGGASHNGGSDFSGLNCVNCHPHSADGSAATSDGFMASCRACHSTTQDLGNGTPRRQIVGATGGDFTRASHHVSGNDLVTDADCQTCHEMSQHTAGKVRLFNADSPATVYTLDYVANITDDPADYENFCISCHDGDGRAGDQTPFSDLKLVPSLNGTLWSSAMHNTVVSTFRGSCVDCHDSGHGSNKVKLLSPWNFVNDANPIDPMRQEERFCYYCHATGGVGTNVQTAFSTYTNTATRFFKHNVDQTNSPHTADEVFGTQFGGANRHTECGDCHGPHEDSAGINTAPATKLQNIGATGVEPVFNGIGAPTRFNFISQPANEYQICLKCHSSYTTLPSYLPEGWGCVTNGCTRTYVPDGLRKLTSANAAQIKDPRDLAAAFNPANASYHPLMAIGKNTTMPAGGFVAGWNVNSRTYCTDCHTNATPATGADGPHGSPLLHILDGSGTVKTNYSTVNAGGNDPMVPNTEVCFKCHDYATYVTSAATTNTRFQDGNNLHSEHMSGGLTTTTCYTCHNSHGSEQAHLINFDASVVAFTGGRNSQTGFIPSATGGTCALACHGQNHNEAYP